MQREVNKQKSWTDRYQRYSAAIAERRLVSSSRNSESKEGEKEITDLLS